MDIINDPTIRFEIPIVTDLLDNSLIYEHKDFGIISITSRIDAIDNLNVWEFKCVDNLTFEHKLQIILYAWAYNKSYMEQEFGKKKFLLLNIKSGELLKLNLDYYKINQIVELIFQDKYTNKKSLNDDEFIKLIKKY
jgi:hypothetical protein